MQDEATKAIPRRWKRLHFLSDDLAEALLVELLELGVRTSEVPARRRDVAVTGQTLGERHADFLRPLRDRGVPEPVRRNVLGQARALCGVSHDGLRHLHAHPV